MECVYILESVGVMKAGLVKTVHEVSVCVCLCVCVLKFMPKAFLFFYNILPEICQPPCVNGTCNVSTGYCDCYPGYTGLSCNEGEVYSDFMEVLILAEYMPSSPCLFFGQNH